MPLNMISSEFEKMAISGFNVFTNSNWYDEASIMKIVFCYVFIPKTGTPILPATTV